MRPRLVVPALVAVLVLAGVACGDGDGDDSTTVEVDDGEVEVSVSEDLDAKPEIEIGEDGFDAESLEVVDLVEGDGEEAVVGSTVSVEYVGLLTDGEQFDASWDRGEPISFTVGSGQVIPGWDEGLVGMKEGGRRLLVIPSALAYGSSGQPQAGIEPDATLLFVVDLVEVS